MYVDVDVGNLLFMKRADVNCTTLEGTTPLIAAAFFGLESMEEIIFKAGGDVSGSTSSVEFGPGT
jgi:hypothetical protein